MRICDRTRFKSPSHYLDYQFKIASSHVVPLLERQQVPLHLPVIDVGCSSGGFAIALATALKTPVFGIDISSSHIDLANQAAKEAGVEAYFEVKDFFKEPLPESRFGLIVLRDVIEHLPDTEGVLRSLRRAVALDGRLYLTFPPWRGPYAGHQHNATGIGRFFPYMHSVAPQTFLKLLHRWEAPREQWLADERQIFATRLSRRRFERILRATGWEIRYRETYFLRPAFIDLGLPTMANGWIGRLPLLGEVLTTECEYLLAPVRGADVVREQFTQKTRIDKM
jgi:SAM-dependent methyltransferase